MLAPAFEHDERAVARLEREGRLGVHVRHANVCAAFYVGRCPSGAPFLVMERLVGETLAAKLARDGASPWPVAQTIIEPMLAGVAAGHACGVVHRDVKPANVFLASTVRVIDFGAAVSTTSHQDSVALTDRGFAFGTLDYMAPEQVRGTDVDARADVYAAALVACEIVTGRRVFSDVPRHELASVIARGGASRVALPPGVPAVVARELVRALSADRTRRPRNAAELRAAMRGAPARNPWDVATAEHTLHRTHRRG
jgi:serine/threonine-protein kinase